MVTLKQFSSLKYKDNCKMVKTKEKRETSEDIYCNVKEKMYKELEKQ